MTERLEKVILESLLHSEEYSRVALPFLKDEYFDLKPDRIIFGEIVRFFENHNKLPTPRILELSLEDHKDLTQDEYGDTKKLIKSLGKAEENHEWLIERTEKFCRDKAIYNAIMTSISIMDGRNTKYSQDGIPSLLQEALAIAFDKNVGHDFFEKAEDRFDFYHKKEDRIPFDLEMFNKITKGGVPRKTLNCILAGCVHPETKVKIRISNDIQKNLEMIVEISKIETLLHNNEIEIDSPDGWVTVTAFVDKGDWDEYRLTLSDGRVIRVNENHLFETPNGWQFAKDLYASHIKMLPTCCYEYICDDGIKTGKIVKTGKKIPIVDIQVDHQNHRYYANGVSSHNTNVGKSLFLCNHAAGVLKAGYNVLYITLEMDERRIAERIDCNLLDIPIDDLYLIDKAEYVERLNSIEHKTNGRLVVKEYPTGGAHVGHFKALIEELKSKKNFVPDVICIDYLNICASQKYKSSNYNSYFAIKAIAEELRGLAVETNTALWTATQATRGGTTEGDLEMTDVSESFGTAASVDFMVAVIRTDELDQMGKLMIKQLKSRYGDVGYYRKFMVNVEIGKFKLTNSDNPTGDVVDSGKTDRPSFDKSKFAKRIPATSDIDFS